MEKIKLTKSQTSILNSIKELDKKIIFFEDNRLIGYLGRQKIDVSGSTSIFFDMVSKGIVIKSDIENKNAYIINPKVTWLSDNIVKLPMTI